MRMLYLCQNYCLNISQCRNALRDNSTRKQFQIALQLYHLWNVYFSIYLYICIWILPSDGGLRVPYFTHITPQCVYYELKSIQKINTQHNADVFCLLKRLTADFVSLKKKHKFDSMQGLDRILFLIFGVSFIIYALIG